MVALTVVFDAWPSHVSILQAQPPSSQGPPRGGTVVPLSMSTTGALPPDPPVLPPVPTLIPPLPVLLPRVLEPGAELAEQAMTAASEAALRQPAIVDQDDDEANDIQ